MNFECFLLMKMWILVLLLLDKIESLILLKRLTMSKFFRECVSSHMQCTRQPWRRLSCQHDTDQYILAWIAQRKTKINPIVLELLKEMFQENVVLIAINSASTCFFVSGMMSLNCSAIPTVVAVLFCWMEHHYYCW